ncbi:MAG: PilZ domain-containing protein [Candidatus Omnitrophica bacterium]|nr:PilZ domain-containing protein [Candidatus Omnitrophota bacterium]
MMRSRSSRALLLVGLAWALPSGGFAAETVNPVTMTKTVVVIAVDSVEPLAFRSSIQERPPVITLTFPKRRVVGSLPERSSFTRGVIRTITARYDRSLKSRASPKRFLQTLQIGLSAPFPARVRSEPGRVVVEIDHPVSVDRASMEVGLRGGTIVSAIGQRALTQRFRAMQEALAQAAATPTAWTMTFTAGEAPQASGGAPARIDSAAIPQEAHAPERGPATGPAPRAAASSSQAPPPSTAHWPLFWTALLVLAAGSVGVWWLARGRPLRLSPGSVPSQPHAPRVPSAVLLVDQLIWRAFERRGYQLLQEAEVAQPSPGTLRVMVKDGAKAALLFDGPGAFCEKQTVERFLQTMQEFHVQQGFLAAAGAFTVPAERLAEQHQITLIGREQLTELLSMGAGSEYVAKQIAQSHARLEEAKEALRQYAGELESLRRQRNEASWYLGEERAKAAQVEAQLNDVSQQVRRHEAQLRRWEQEATTLRRQWEESQWYLGESVARVRHLEAQLGALQEATKRAETAEQEQETLRGDLAQEQARREGLETQLAALQRNLEESAKRELALQFALEQLKQEMRRLKTAGDRRRQPRAAVSQAFVELLNGRDRPLFAGTPRDVSSVGLGLETDQKLPDDSPVRVRLRLPGRDPIESRGRIVWQRAAGAPRRYRSGCRLLRVPAATRALIGKALQEIQA